MSVGPSTTRVVALEFVEEIVEDKTKIPRVFHGYWDGKFM